ncbi:MAG: HEPN domain-containing protein [Sedimentisphaerales bacterium]|nr:HEPN domain-containing protein [Sedimentisphaerales bacterium]
MDDTIKEFYKQWLVKAQEDWDAVEILIDQKRPPKGAVCFHCQQCIEKLLKAILVREQIEFPKTHDIGRLIELVRKFVPGSTEFSLHAKKLSVYGVDMRYPDEAIEVSTADMKQIFDITEKFRQILLKAT